MVDRLGDLGSSRSSSETPSPRQRGGVFSDNGYARLDQSRLRLEHSSTATALRIVRRWPGAESGEPPQWPRLSSWTSRARPWLTRGFRCVPRGNPR